MFTLFAAMMLVGFVTVIVAYVAAMVTARTYEARVPMMVRVAGLAEAVASWAWDRHFETQAREVARAMLPKASRPSMLSTIRRKIVAMKVDLGWWHAQSATVRRIARPVRLARHHAYTAVKVACLVALVASAGCSLVRSLPTRQEAERSTSTILGAASSNARFLR